MSIASLGNPLEAFRLSDRVRVEPVPRVRRRADSDSPIARLDPAHAQPADELRLSPAAERAADEEANATDDTEEAKTSEAKSDTAAPTELTEEERQQVQNLKARDREVRQHEQAHLAAAGPYARGGATYTYQRGPDGRRYAVGGEVQIDTAPVPGDPEATIAKARVIRRAALAPAEPSSQDRAVAAQAAQMENTARQELIKQNATGESDQTDAGHHDSEHTGDEDERRPGERLDLVA